MDKYKFNIYVGDRLFAGQADDIVAVAEPRFYIPSGHFGLNGEERNTCNISCFKKLYDLGTYIADWIDLFGNENAISANIVLNIQSLHKVFVGKSIIDILDKLDKVGNYKRIRSFSELK